jgi:hypothetical protein
MTLFRTATAGVLLTVLAAGPAQAADEVGLSRTGEVWAPSLSGVLFDSPHRWVPGDSETRGFLVRNQGPSAATMTIRVETTDPDALLAADDVVLRARLAGQPWHDLAAGTRQALTTEVLPTRGTRRVEVQVRFLASSTNRSETRRLPLRFVVTLTDAAAGPGSHGGEIPAAGSTLQPHTLATAVALIGVGFLLMRRRRKENPHG